MALTRTQLGLTIFGALAAVAALWIVAWAIYTRVADLPGRAVDRAKAGALKYVSPTFPAATPDAGDDDEDAADSDQYR